MTPGDEPVPHDPWLREALRHAPDADAGPPARLDDHILRMGRAAVAPRPAPAPPRPPTLAEQLLAAWDWLARPPVAAGFAGVLVASVVGVMWWGRPIQDALPPREEPAPAAQAPVPPDPLPPPVVARVPAPAETRAPSIDAARPLAKAEAPARKAAAPEPAQQAAAPAAPVPATADKQADKKAERATSAEDTATLRGSAIEQRQFAAPAVPSGPAAPSAPVTAAAPPPAGMSAAEAAAPAGLGALRARAVAGTIETAGLSNLRFEIRPRPQAWRWQRNDGPEQPVDEALQNWIALADRTARPHWNPGTTAGEGATTTLRFTRDGTLRATLRVGPKGLRLDRAGKSESAELSAAQAATLIDALAALGP